MTSLAHRAVGLGLHPALLVIDATCGFTEISSPLGMDGGAVLARVQQLLEIFRARGWPVVFTSNAYANDAEASVFRAKLPILNHLAVGSRWAEIDPRVAPQADEQVLRKTVPSAFFDSPLRDILRVRGVDSVLVCGFSTSGCVRATVVDALQCNLRVLVVADACGDRDPAAHEYNLRDIELKLGDVLDARAALTLLAAVK